MSKQIQYTDEPLGEMKLVPDFLPAPKEFALTNKERTRRRTAYISGRGKWDECSADMELSAELMRVHEDD